MTVVSHPLGKPLPAHVRGGDCRARDLYLGRNVHGPHDFLQPEHCWLGNGLMRVTVGPAGGAPTLAIHAWRGVVAVNDGLSDVLSDTLSGGLSTPEWLELGTVTIDSPSVAAVLTSAVLWSISAGSVTVRLVAPLISDAYVTLRRGERHVRIQHGEGTTVDADRRVRVTPSPTGTAFPGRVEELVPALDGFPRFVGSLTPTTEDAGAFSLTAPSVTSARFGVGVGTYADLDRPVWLHRQLGDTTTERVTFAPEAIPGEGTYGSYGEGY